MKETEFTDEMRADILSAAVLGNMAFNNGLKRIPCFDKDLMNMKLMTIWCENWDLANLDNNY
ncbi:hypothetical protein IR083_20770 [Dysgonomonas sp. GY75]|uniref:hypothetical protein n=1 Tax=Dysgonomonas sp. GY75 TaxID=2780419 RepID=UPI0018833E5D|nr:hypothetical protein [Dysgonomonas sp. GY75]MBF0651255.1 hypothetical protein [Dysgonomonas sp. GY75]